MYLNGPRFSFSGDFAADTSTVNNDVRHYDNASFERRFQDPADGRVENGWWNPTGGSALGFPGCSVRSATAADGTSIETDALLAANVAGPRDRSSGKMIDIDPQAQMYTQLWAVTLRFVQADGTVLLQGDLKTPSFRDLQPRQFVSDGGATNGLPNGQPYGASWTSVLHNLHWGDISTSPVLRALRDTIDEAQLSVNLSAFGYFYADADGRYSMGRLLGTVGPYSSGEPELFARARRLVGLNDFNFSNACHDRQSGMVVVDLGGSLPLSDPLGAAIDVGTLQIAVATGTAPKVGANPAPGDYVVIGQVDYSADDWLMSTSGIVSLPVPEAAAALVDDHQLLLLTTNNGPVTARAVETTDGLLVRADNTVQRLNPGDPPVVVSIHAAQWGAPLAGKQISLTMAKPSAAGGGPPNDPEPPTAPYPKTNHPSTALQFPESVTTDEQGKAEVSIAGTDPGNPRGYVDGQIYQLNYTFDGIVQGETDPMDQIVVHLRTAFVAPEHPTWADIAPTLIQYGNLYPLMSRHISDLSDPSAVLAKRDILLHAFKRDFDAPDYMPAQRDLSPGKLQAIIRWLEEAPAEPVAEVAIASGQTAPVEPDPSEMERRAAITMTRSAYEQLTSVRGGKADAIRGAVDAIDIIDD